MRFNTIRYYNMNNINQKLWPKGQVFIEKFTILDIYIKNIYEYQFSNVIFNLIIQKHSKSNIRIINFGLSSSLLYHKYSFRDPYVFKIISVIPIIIYIYI